MKPDMLERFAFIETRVYWGDGLTAQELGRVFRLARQTAQGVIDAYKRLHPNALTYDEKRRRQMATPDFQPNYIRRTPEAFLGHLRAQAMNAYYRQESEWDDLPFHDVDHVVRPNLKLEPMRVLLAALQEQKNIIMHYYSKLSARQRVFSPNSLVFAGNRYHIRGYCHLQKNFLDFVLSRIVYAEASDTEWISSRDDDDWNSYVTLYFQPHPALTEEAHDALCRDFKLNGNGCYRLNCRRALAFYVQRELTAIDSQLGLPRWIRTGL